MERYDLEIYHYNTGRYINGLKPNKEGRWVKYEEAVNLITELEQRLAAAEAMNKKLLDERIIDRNLYYERGCEQGKLYIQEMLKEALGI